VLDVRGCDLRQLEELGERGVARQVIRHRKLLDRWVAASRAGNPRPARGVTAPELEVVTREHPAAQPETRTGSQQVLVEHLLGEVVRVLPGIGLNT
jgi:hypothetical protein